MPRMVLVKWRDTESMSGWKSTLVAGEFASEDCDVVESVGFLHSKNKKVVVIYQSRHHYENGTNFSELLKIPLSAVVKIKKLGVE